MLRLLYLSILLSTLFCTSKTQKAIKQNENKERFYLKAKVGTVANEKTNMHFTIITQLINDTEDTINYLSMSCSWYDFYYVEVEQITLDEIGCDKNVPELITILPHSMDQGRILKFRTRKSFKELHGLKFRVGFNFVPVDRYEDVFKKFEQQYKPGKNMVWERIKPTNMLWSDSLTIQ